MTRFKSVSLLLTALLCLSGCESNNVGDRAMVGGAIGAGLGGIAGAVAHNGSVLQGAGLGAAAGILVGVLSD